VVDILRNLISNAVESMLNGGTITLRARTAGTLVALDVIDTGSGIPPQHQRRIFDLFYSTKGSSGFGLWSARKNAIKNRGDLRLTSEVGQGTTFTLLLPGEEGLLYEVTY
jgi:signal transduction histidine kinase